MTTIFSTHELHPIIEEKLSQTASYCVASNTDPDTIMAEGKDAEILIVRANIPPPYFQEASQLRAAIRHGAGLDMIPVDAATSHGVLVANVPGANARTVAEHVIFTAIALLRRFRLMDRDLRKDGWHAARQHSDFANELSDRTVGIVGMGNIGRQVFQLAAHGFDLPVICHTRSPQNLPAEVCPVSMDRLVEESDIIVLCCPLNSQTTGLLNAQRIARIKPEALVINVSRGAVVDEMALVQALQAKRIGGAALDVFDQQPLPASHPLFAMDNVIITPHMAGVTRESMFRMGSVVADETIRILNGEFPKNFCNPQVTHSYKQRFPS